MTDAYRYGKNYGIALSKDYPYCDACKDTNCHSYVGRNCMSTDLKCYRASSALRL